MLRPLQSKHRQVSQDAPHEFFIFLRLQAARAIDKHSARSQQIEDRADNFELLPLHANKVRRLQPPSDIDPPSHHPGIAAWCVDQDAIERSDRSNFFRDATASPIMREEMSNSDPELRHIFFKDTNALRCAVAGHNHAAISHELCDVTCLPARRRTRIEDFFSRLRIEKLASDRRARILNIAMTPLERFGWKCVQLDED